MLSEVQNPTEVDGCKARGAKCTRIIFVSIVSLHGFGKKNVVPRLFKNKILRPAQIFFFFQIAAYLRWVKNVYAECTTRKKQKK